MINMTNGSDIDVRLGTVKGCNVTDKVVDIFGVGGVEIECSGKSGSHLLGLSIMASGKRCKLEIMLSLYGCLNVCMFVWVTQKKKYLCLH